jgi:hypothetical protein
MNTPSISSTAIHQRAAAALPSELTAELIALPQRGRILRFLTGMFAILTAICGLATLLEQLPPQYAAVGLLFTTALLGIKDLVISIGDLLDDGKRNNSFGNNSEPRTANREPQSANPSVLRQWFLFFLLPCLCVGCASETSTDAEISRAQLALSGSRIALVVAQSQLGALASDPKAPSWKLTAARAAVSEAQTALETESLRLRSIMAARNVARFATPAVPVIDLTSAK